MSAAPIPAPVLGLACAAPLAALLALRYIALRPVLDARARRSYFGKSSAYAAAAWAAASLVAAAGRSLALPAHWAVALAALALLLLSRSFRRGG